MKKHLWKKVMLSIFVILLLVLALPVVGQVIGIEFDTSTDDYNSVVSHKTHLIAPGITENTIILNDATGNNQNVGYTMKKFQALFWN